MQQRPNLRFIVSYFKLKFNEHRVESYPIPAPKCFTPISDILFVLYKAEIEIPFRKFMNHTQEQR